MEKEGVEEERGLHAYPLLIPFISHLSQPCKKAKKAKGFPELRKRESGDKFQTWPDSRSLTGKNTIHLFLLMVAALGGCLAVS